MRGYTASTLESVHNFCQVITFLWSFDVKLMLHVLSFISDYTCNLVSYRR
jgi:hypothetical protein